MRWEIFTTISEPYEISYLIATISKAHPIEIEMSPSAANSLNLTLWMLRKTCLGGALIELRIVSNNSILNSSKQIGFELTNYFWLLHLMSSKWCLVSSFSLYLHHFQFCIQCCYLHNEELKIYNICSGTDPGACKGSRPPKLFKILKTLLYFFKISYLHVYFTSFLQ